MITVSNSTPLIVVIRGGNLFGAMEVKASK